MSEPFFLPVPIPLDDDWTEPDPDEPEDEPLGPDDDPWGIEAYDRRREGPW